MICIMLWIDDCTKAVLRRSKSTHIPQFDLLIDLHYDIASPHEDADKRTLPDIENSYQYSNVNRYRYHQ